MGMLGKAWSTGALMMVQVADTLPKGFHPRTKLDGTFTCPAAQCLNGLVQPCTCHKHLSAR